MEVFGLIRIGGIHVRNSSFFRRKLSLFIFCSIFLAGVLVILVNTKNGIGIYHDSVFYLTSATNLVNGEGLSWFGDGGSLTPLTHFAPLYPLNISAFIALGADAEGAARWIAAILFGANIALIGYLVAHFTRRITSGIITSVLVLISPVLVGVHTIALSEPIFIFFTLIFITLLTYYIVSPSWRTFILMVIFAALGYLSRYVGIVLLGTGFLVLLFLQDQNLRRRIRDSALFFFLAFIPMLSWLLRNFCLTGLTTNRIFQFHPPERFILNAFLDTLLTWIVPIELSTSIQLVIVIGFIVILCYILYRLFKSTDFHKNRSLVFSTILVIFLSIYLLSLAFSITFFDAATPVDNRTLGPVFISLLLISILLLATVLTEGKYKLLRIPFFLIIVIYSLNSLAKSSEILRELRDDGVGFSNHNWQTSATIDWVLNLPEDVLIYSNEMLALTYLTGYPAFSIPEKIDTVRAEIRPNFEEEMGFMYDRLRKPESYLVLFHPFHLRWEMPTRDEITYPFSRLVDFEDAIVYISPNNLE